MADPVLRIEAPNLRTRRGARIAGALVAVLIHLLPIALLWTGGEPVRDEPATLPPLQITLHDRPAGALASAPLDVPLSAPDFELVPPEVRVQAETEAPADAGSDAPSAPPTAVASSPAAVPATGPRAASARDCWPHRWLLRMSRTIESALKYPADANRRGLRGTAFVRVSIERSGRVLQAALVRGSGHAQLDAEARAVIGRIGRFEPFASGDCVGYDVIVVDQPVRFGQ